MGKESVLLCLVEPVDFIHEQNGPLPAGRSALLGTLEDRAQLGHAAGHSREWNKLPLRMPGNEMGERRLPRAGRSPEDHGRELIGLDGPSQRSILRRDIVLPYKICKLSRTHPLGEWSRDRIFAVL